MWAMIPGSMGTRSYIVTGLENPMAFHSAPHGAGRRYSRTAARKLFTMKDLETAMSGIEFRRAHELLDEIPSAYKDIDEVIGGHARQAGSGPNPARQVGRRSGLPDRVPVGGMYLAAVW